MKKLSPKANIKCEYCGKDAKLKETSPRWNRMFGDGEYLMVCQECFDKCEQKVVDYWEKQ